MNKKLISAMLASESPQQLDSIIQARINEEKDEYMRRLSLKRKANKGFNEYITPPRYTDDLEPVIFEEFLHPDRVGISISASGPLYMYYFDDEREIYELLASNLSRYEKLDDTSVLQAVADSIFEYIGGSSVVGDDFDRLAVIKPASELDDGEKNKISKYKGTQKAWCMERACFAHQMFKFLGIDSKMVVSNILNNGEVQVHTFNLIKMGKKSLIFDTSVIPPPVDGKQDPVAMILPEEVFDKNMKDIAPLPQREIVGRSGKKYTFIYDLKNREEQAQVRGQ